MRYKIFILDLPTNQNGMLPLRFSSVGQVIQVNMNGFLTDKISPTAGVPQGSVLSSLLFLIYVNDDDTALWAASRNIQFAAKRLHKDA